MTATLTLDSYLATLDGEYLTSFISAGGAAVKFVVPVDETPTTTIGDRIVASADAAHHVVARVSAAATRIHMIDKFFSTVAEQVPWHQLATERLAALARKSFLVPDLDDSPFDVQISEANGAELEYVRMVLNKEIANEVFKDHDLARDFRIAMTWLCRARLSGGAEGNTQFDAITEWLTGATSAISNLKQYQIYTKINRTNARYHLESLCMWVRKCGFAGTTIVIDGTRLTEAKPERDGTVTYTKSALLDAYEVFRQFIDSTDHSTALLIAVVLTDEFLDIEPGSRGLGAYSALMNRVYDEVRDRNFANPMASLVRLTNGVGQ